MPGLHGWAAAHGVGADAAAALPSAPLAAAAAARRAHLDEQREEQARRLLAPLQPWVRARPRGARGRCFVWLFIVGHANHLVDWPRH